MYLTSVSRGPPGNPESFCNQVVGTGLSWGGGIGIEMAVAYHELIPGLVLVAGPRSDYDGGCTKAYGRLSIRKVKSAA